MVHRAAAAYGRQLKIKAKEQKRTVDRAVNVKSQMIIILFSLHFVSMCEFNFSQIIKGNNLICVELEMDINFS